MWDGQSGASDASHAGGPAVTRDGDLHHGLPLGMFPGEEIRDPCIGSVHAVGILWGTSRQHVEVADAARHRGGRDPTMVAGCAAE
jgi:hypothetical protein